MNQVDGLEVAMRAARTALLTGETIVLMEPEARRLFASLIPALRVALPVLAVGLAAALSVLGRRIATRGHSTQRTARYLLAVGWMLAGAIVLRHLATVEPDLAVLMVSALVLPARAAMRW